MVPLLTGPRFPRFAAAMAAARAANAAPFNMYGDPSLNDIPPQVSPDSPAPRHAQWRAPPAPRSPVAGWLGIGACALLFGVVAVTMLTPPISAGIQRLVSPWLEWQRGPQTAAPDTGPALPATPEPAAGRNDAPSRSPSVEALAAPGADGRRDASTPAAGVRVVAPDDPPAASPPARPAPAPSVPAESASVASAPLPSAPAPSVPVASAPDPSIPADPAPVASVPIPAFKPPVSDE